MNSIYNFNRLGYTKDKVRVKVRETKLFNSKSSS